MSSRPYPCLWFNQNAKEAADYYCSIFKDSKVLSENNLVILVELNQQKFMLLNGNVNQPFNESVSFVIHCETQTEIDDYWNAFTKEGKEGMCGWCQDKYGVSWQIVPSILGKLMSDPEKNQRVVQAFLKMRKFIISDLENA